MEGDVPRDDGLKWFGEGFDGFPKRLPEDCVEYVIYAIDEKLKDAEATKDRINQILKRTEGLKKDLTKDYIWQRDEFFLRSYPNLSAHDHPNGNPNQSEKTHYLKGRTNFGDSIADEWLIVYLLVELSKQCPDAWIRVYDTDGEFLLIEAANALPKWLNPDIAENRVWINNGHLRIIPLDDSASSRNLGIGEALSFIRQNHNDLIISHLLEDEAFYRLREYPSAISSSLHRSLITIPRRLTYVLHSKPAYISPAIESFYLRDPISLKPLATKDTATLHFPPEDFVTVSTKFTKVGYAQLRSQLFDTPPAWTGIIPRLNDPKVEMGMKLTCGFEMLISDPQNRDRRNVREIHILLDDADEDKTLLPSDSVIAEWAKTQDDEKWLDIDYNDFEKELSGKKGNDGKDGGAGFGDKGAQDNLRKMVSRFEDFLNDDDAGAEGVADEDDDDDESDDDEDDDDSDEAEKERKHEAVHNSSEKTEPSSDETEFEQAMKVARNMPSDQVEKSGLLDEARRLALEDEEDGEAPDEEEELRKVMEMMERELKSHGALNLDDKAKPANTSVKRTTAEPPKEAVYFGPERPPGMAASKSSNAPFVESDSEADEEVDGEVGPGDGELSSDDEEFNDVDLGLAKNMLEAFKGQAGMAGPAGNLMKALGVGMPRDEGEDND